MKHHMVSLSLLLLIQPPVLAGNDFFLKDVKRVLFLGDSNTFAGHFIAYIDGYLVTRFPDKDFELINLGLPSETVTGLSEPDHPYPRPNVQDRVERALAKTKPNVVVICYGMNDGIYYPFSEERFSKYRAGIQQLIDRAQKAGVKVVLMTPAPFDPLPLAGRTLPASAAKFSWVKPYQNYDDVLTRYSAWLVSLRNQGFLVVDAHTAINHYLAEMRKTNPKYVISGDGIHPNTIGHRIIAEEILRTMKASRNMATTVIDAKTRQVNRGKILGLTFSDGELKFRWEIGLPFPTLPPEYNRLVLKVTGLTGERYDLLEGKKLLGEVSARELATGVNLSRFPDLSALRRGAKLGELTEKRQSLLGLAWLSDVGHKRPDTPKGLPLPEAQRKAENIQGMIQKLAQPILIDLRLVPRKTRNFQVEK